MQNKVNFGWVSKTLLMTFLLSLWPTIQLGVESGQLPGRPAIMSGLILALFAVVRVGQQMLLDYTSAKWGAAIPGVEPAPVDPVTSDMENLG